MEILPEDILKLVLSVLVGGAVGAEREFRDKAAGFRTIIFICVGATLFTIFSHKIGVAYDRDVTRIAANVVSGVGFLGAGVILREGGRVMGLTTAATVWLAAALGMGIGAGYYAFTGLATAAVLIVLGLFPFIEHKIDDFRDTKVYEVVCAIDPTRFKRLEGVFRECGLRVRSHKEMKRGDEMICVWEAIGSAAQHEQLMERLFADPEVKEMKF